MFSLKLTYLLAIRLFRTRFFISCSDVFACPGIGLEFKTLICFTNKRKYKIVHGQYTQTTGDMRSILKQQTSDKYIGIIKYIVFLEK